MTRYSGLSVWLRVNLNLGNGRVTIQMVNMYTGWQKRQECLTWHNQFNIIYFEKKITGIYNMASALGEVIIFFEGLVTSPHSLTTKETSARRCPSPCDDLPQDMTKWLLSEIPTASAPFQTDELTACAHWSLQVRVCVLEKDAELEEPARILQPVWYFCLMKPLD